MKTIALNNKKGKNNVVHVAIALLVLIASVFGCKKIYAPAVTSTDSSILVVEGLINVGTDSTQIRLSRTVIIASKTALSPESKATVTVENAAGTSYALPETSVKGTYASPSLHLDNTKQYRVRIKTGNGKTYASDLVDPKVTPPIDSIGFKEKNNGIEVYANTHDPNNATRYYKYTFRETWRFNAYYFTGYIGDGINLNIRRTDQYIVSCFGTDTSAHSILNSTAALSQDVAYQFPINDIEATSEKLEIRYSILLTQTALSKEAYDFWQNLKKNTEDLGSIFDAQPSVLVGNIHNIANAAEPVIGYISAGTIQKKRIYIDKSQLPASFKTVYPYSCEIDTAVDSPATGLSKYVDIRPIAFVLPPHGYVTNIIGGFYLYTTPVCADCTLRGTTKTPYFWK